MKKKKVPLVFFNASVILAGIGSPTGGSAKLLRFVYQKRIAGVINGIILGEVIKNAQKIAKDKDKLEKEILLIFSGLSSLPTKEQAEMFKAVVLDPGDAHVLAAAKRARADFLVTLDRRHLLVLKDKIRQPKIVSPKELIEKLRF